MRRVFSILCVLLVVAFVVPMIAISVEAVETRASDYFMEDSCYLYKTSSTEFEAWFDVTGVDGMDEIGAKSIKIQRSSDGTNWTDMKTYTKESYPSLIAKNTAFHDGCVTYTATAGYYYRAYVVFYAKNGTGSATLGRYTSKLKM